jgi:hypothetical protein
MKRLAIGAGVIAVLGGLAWLAFFVYWIFIAVAPGFDRSKNVLAEDVQESLKTSGSFTLLSLSPSDTAPSGTNVAPMFRGFTILGSTEIKDRSQRIELISQLAKGIAASRGMVYNCFNPRHGIRAVNGTSQIDLVICFECAQVHLFASSNNNVTKVLLQTETAKAMFERAVKRAGLPVSGD